MKKLVTLALMLAVGSFGLVGCGGAPATTKKTEEKKVEEKKADGSEKKTEEKKTEEKKDAEAK